jgi:Na+-driven multidrug efflux pump
VIISRASQEVVGLSDAVMIAHLGGTPLAATTTGAMNAFTLFIFPMGVVFVSSPALPPSPRHRARGGVCRSRFR